MKPPEDQPGSGTGKPDEAAAGDGQVESISRDAAGRLVVKIRGRPEPVVEAAVARCFPWSLPDRYVSVRDKQGKEIALYESLDGLDAASRAVAEDELRDKIFRPLILRILDHRREYDVTSVTAETDRGRVTFEIRTRDDIRALSDRRILFRDADGNTYEVRDRDRLDPASRRLLEEYF